MNKKEAIELGLEWLANAPYFDGVYVGPVFMSGIAGCVCRVCCRRIIARGCDLKRIANTPIWEPQIHDECVLCGSEEMQRQMEDQQREQEPMIITREMAMDAQMPEIEGMTL